MDYKARYEEWISNSYFDEDTRAELESIKEDENEIKERFYMDLEFGTAGLRGIIGAGTNRMNIYTVRKATQGLANYIMKNDGQGKGVAIAYDSRHMSTEFAKEEMCIRDRKNSGKSSPELSFVHACLAFLLCLFFVLFIFIRRFKNNLIRIHKS